MPYKPPKMTPKAASRERSKQRANARTRQTLSTPGEVVSKGMEPLGLPVRGGAASVISALAGMTKSNRYGSGRQSTKENAARVAEAYKYRKNTSRFNVKPGSPAAKKIKALDTAISTKPTSQREWTKAEWRQVVRDAKAKKTVQRPASSASGNIRKFKEDTKAYENYLRIARNKQLVEKAQKEARRAAVKQTIARRKKA